VEIRRGNRKVMNIKRTRSLKKCNIEKTEELDQLIEELKQKVSAKTQRLSRYKKRQNQYYQNKLFRTDGKKFYNRLRQTYPNVNNAPGREEVENFWRKIYGKKVQHNREAGWIKKQYQQNPSMEWSPICVKDIEEALRTMLNWKAPGREKYQIFGLSNLTATHKHIAAIINKLIEEDQIPVWLTAGVTFLIPKNENTENPKNYRPVTSLPTMYKLITYVISRRMQKYMDDENLIPKEQKGCYSVSK
jgi:tetrahydromethanopterin S-methyltransferase subunit B